MMRKNFLSAFWEKNFRYPIVRHCSHRFIADNLNCRFLVRIKLGSPIIFKQERPGKK